MTTQRDELAELIANTENPTLAPAWPDRADLSPVKFYSRKTAEAILATGYRKPRTITTVEELDVLPEDAVVFTNTAWLRVMSSHGLLVWGCVGSRKIYTAEDVTLPATVLYEPTA